MKNKSFTAGACLWEVDYEDPKTGNTTNFIVRMLPVHSGPLKSSDMRKIEVFEQCFGGNKLLAEYQAIATWARSYANARMFVKKYLSER